VISFMTRVMTARNMLGISKHLLPSRPFSLVQKPRWFVNTEFITAVSPDDWQDQ
jgi:hypothetical protein